MKKLPLTYKPKKLRSQKEENRLGSTFSVVILGQGFNQKPVYGPTTLENSLEYIPESSGDHAIVRTDSDGFETLVYAWNHSNGLWYLLADEEDNY